MERIIFVKDTDNVIYRFNSIQEAENELEFIDVEDGEYQICDSKGVIYQFEIYKERETFKIVATDKRDPELIKEFQKMETENKEKNNYIVLFKGVKLPKRGANKVGLGIIFGIIGIFVSVLIVGRENKNLSYIIILVFIAIGYFWLGNKIFKK